ncbi:MAG: YfiR family protein [Nitrospinae bacterium]|nr:YfiR family protein [Nitrospinota bacterium]
MLKILRKYFCLFLAMAVFPSASALAEPNPEAIYAEEYKIKAGFLYYFAKFVEWPPGVFDNTKDKVVLGVLGKDPFSGALESLEGQAVMGKKIAIKRFHDVEELDACHVLFISSSEKDSLPQILRALKKSKILTVGDSEGFTRQGGTIGFITEGKQVHFEINLKAAEEAGLVLSARLLSLARNIKGLKNKN